MLLLIRASRRAASSIGAAASAGVAFDIDGVLMRGKQPVASAGAALRALQDGGVPFVLLTNGGGYPESVKAQALSEALDVVIGADQVVLSHTPMRDLVELYGEKRVLVLGKRYEQLSAVMESYGFADVVTAEELHAQHPTLYGDVAVEEAAAARVASWSHATASKPIDAVLALTDPVLWGREVQLACDVLRAPGGVPGGVPRRAPGGAAQVPFFSACADFEYTAEPAVPRLGSGAFHFALEAIYRASVGRPLDAVRFGKPEGASFAFAERLIDARAAALGVPPPTSLFMVGDNPLTDIKGAKRAGGRWRAVLTQSGMFTGAAAENAALPEPADYVVPDVGSIVEIVLGEHSLQGSSAK